MMLSVPEGLVFENKIGPLFRRSHLKDTEWPLHL